MSVVRVRRVPVAALLSALVVSLLGSAGCTALGRIIDFKDQAAEARATVRISGRIETEGPAEGTLVVVLGRHIEGEEIPVGVDAYVRANPGSFLFLVGPGNYQLGAYEDRNRNGMLDPDERVVRLRDGEIHQLDAGGRVTVDLMLRNDSPLGDALPEPLDILALVERSAKEQGEFSLWAFSKQGEVADLEDERFGPEAGPRGLWQPMDFMNDELAGIYLLEPYDPDRIPVIFVHGISGYPQQFSTLIDRLDRNEFQPWFYFYPSGFALDGISNHFAELLTRLQIKLGSGDMAIVAHSMGGLVSRGAIFKYAAETQREDVRLFISISSPFGGDVTAKKTEGAPIELPMSFTDMNPSSNYLTWVFYEDDEREIVKPLPRRVDYHMLFGFGGKGGTCSDGTVSCASQAFYDNQQQALSVRALDYQHVPILHSDEAVARVNLLLEERF